MKEAQLPHTCLASLAAILFATVSAGQASWFRVATPTQPTAGLSAAMVFDELGGKCILFGGPDNAGNATNETWSYQGTTGQWTPLITSTSPSPRIWHRMCYDSHRDIIVLFGGVGPNSNYPNDTWEFDGTNWNLQSTPISPSGRHLAAMCFDSHRGVVVLYGGYANGLYSNETWEYSSQGWLQKSPGPGPRQGHCMAFDSIRNTVVMFGGHDPSPTWLSDTWEYDGTNWFPASSGNQPPARAYHSMTYDEARGVTIVHGGVAGNGGPQADVSWEYDGVNWNTAPNDGAQPSITSQTSMTYDSTMQQVVMVTRHNSDVETWVYKDNNSGLHPSSSSVYGAGCGSPMMTMSPVDPPKIGFTASADIINMPTQVAGVAIGWSNTFSFPIPLPFELSSLGMPGCLLLQSSEAFGLPVQTQINGQGLFELPIPFAPSIIGTHLYAQAYSLSPGSNLLGVIASNGIDWEIGDV